METSHWREHRASIFGLRDELTQTPGREAFAQLLLKLDVKCEETTVGTLHCRKQRCARQDPQVIFDFFDVRSCGSVGISEATRDMCSVAAARASATGRLQSAEPHTGRKGKAMPVRIGVGCATRTYRNLVYLPCNSPARVDEQTCPKRHRISKCTY